MKSARKFSLLFILFVLGAITFCFVVFSLVWDHLSAQSPFLGVPSVDEIIQLCQDGKRDIHVSKRFCYGEILEEIASSQEYETAFFLLKEIQKKDIEATACHLIAHEIGAGAFKKDPRQWQELFNTMPIMCSYGAPHGVLEAYANVGAPNGPISTIIPSLCPETARGECTHIVGHLLLAENMGDIEKALAICSSIEIERRRVPCYNGVFMENITALNLIEHGLAQESWRNTSLRLSELTKLCLAQKGEKEVACWKEIAHDAHKKFRRDPAALFGFCDAAHAAQAALACRLHSVDMLNSSLQYNFSEVKKICTIDFSRDSLFEGKCYARIARSALLTAPEKLARSVVEFCMALPNKFQNSCRAEIELMRGSTKIKEGIELESL